MQSLNWDDLANRAEATGAGQEPVPANTYTVTVAACEAKTTTNGKPMLKVRAKINGGPYDGKTVWNQMVLSQENDTAVAIFLRHLAAFGLDKAYLSQGPSFEQIAVALIGRQVSYVVKVGAYNGKPKNEVDDVRPVTGAVPAAPAQPGVPQVPAPVAPAAPAPPEAPVPAPAPAPAPAAPEPPVSAPPVPVPAPAPVPEAPAAPAAPAPPGPPF